jgi:hypothetical protein
MKIEIDSQLLAKIKKLDECEFLNKEDLKAFTEDLANELLDEYISDKILEQEQVFPNDDDEE